MRTASALILGAILTGSAIERTQDGHPPVKLSATTAAAVAEIEKGAARDVGQLRSKLSNNGFVWTLLDDGY